MRQPVLIAVLALALTLSACGGSGEETAATDTGGATYLFVLDVPNATARPTATGYELTLTGLDPRITWFSDRPYRLAGSMPTGELLARWNEFGFGDVPPNATITIHPVGGTPRAVPVIVSRPTGDLAGGRLVLELQQLPLADGEAVEPLPRELGPTSVFLDSVSYSNDASGNTNLSQQNAVANQQAMSQLDVCPLGPPCPKPESP